MLVVYNNRFNFIYLYVKFYELKTFMIKSTNLKCTELQIQFAFVEMYTQMWHRRTFRKKMKEQKDTERKTNETKIKTGICVVKLLVNWFGIHVCCELLQWHINIRILFRYIYKETTKFLENKKRKYKYRNLFWKMVLIWLTWFSVWTSAQCSFSPSLSVILFFPFSEFYIY